MQTKKLFAQRNKKPYRKIVVSFSKHELEYHAILGIEYLISVLKEAGIPIIRGEPSLSERTKYQIGVSYGSFERFNNVNTNIVVFTWISDRPHVKKVYKKRKKKNLFTQDRRIRI